MHTQRQPRNRKCQSKQTRDASKFFGGNHGEGTFSRDELHFNAASRRNAQLRIHSAIPRMADVRGNKE